jgi:hypothetical protein
VFDQSIIPSGPIVKVVPVAMKNLSTDLIERLIGKQQNNTDSKPWLDSISDAYKYSSYLDINKTQCLGGKKIKDTLYI